jgi:hypothetical protein
MQVKQYETIFILTPVLSEAQVTEVAEKFKQVLKENSADLLHEEFMGLRRFRKKALATTSCWSTRSAPRMRSMYSNWRSAATSAYCAS